jgi:precorrin-2 dehydrogenase/sirohydrochlorin ferrochelatase
MFPVFLDLRGRLAVVVGGGSVGRRKAAALRGAGARVRLVCLEPRPDDLADEALEWLAESYEPRHLDGAVLVFAAGPAALNERVVSDARARGVWVSSVSDPEAGDFITGATMRSGDLVMAISTGGAAPALARRIRERLEAEFDDTFASWLALLGEFRPLIQAAVPDEERRRGLWEELTRWQWLQRVRGEGIDAVRQALRGMMEQGFVVAPPAEIGHDGGSEGAHDNGPCAWKEASMSECNAPTPIEPFPEPDAVEREALEEWSWVIQERSKGRFDDYLGQYVAVVNHTVLGSSLDPNLLRTSVSEKHQIDPRRIVIFRVYAW